MKHYNTQAWNNHIHELKGLDKSVLFHEMLYRVHTLTYNIPKDYSKIGILNAEDLLQEAYLIFLQAWEKIDWGKIEGSNEPENVLWAFLSKRIKDRLKRQVNVYVSGIRIPESQRRIQEEWFGIESLFPVFFGRFEQPNTGEVTSWAIEKLAYALDQVMDEHLSFEEAQLLKKFYGVDYEKSTLRELAEDFNKNESALQNMKHRALKKLRNIDVKNYILNHFNF